VSCDICHADAPTLTISTSGCGCCDDPADVCMDCARTRPLRDLLTAKTSRGGAVRVTGSHYSEIEPDKLAKMLAAGGDDDA
jgi:hypothetical protein